jgi:chemotaxis protein CheX
MSKSELDQTYLAEVMHVAATEVFATMLGCEIKPESAQPGSSVETVDHGIIALLGLTGDWTGSAGLCCSAECARWIASQMLFSEYPEVNEEVRDAVGETANMIVGSFKNSLSPRTGPLAMSTPTVVTGSNMSTSTGGAHEWIVFPFSSNEHSFRMMVQLRPAGARSGSMATRAVCVAAR